MLDVEIIAGDFAVEDAFGYFQLGALLLHAPCKSRQFSHSIGTHSVLEDEAGSGDDCRHEDERRENADERDAGRLHAEQLEMLAQVAERDEACQKDCQRHRPGDKRQAAVPEELGKQVDCKSLSDEVVHPHPQELHDKNEQANEERSCEKHHELLYYIYMELFNPVHFRNRGAKLV